MPTLLASVPPITVGQLVTVRSDDEDLPGTIVELSPLGDGRWEVRVEVLATFGVGTSRHVIDDAGREVDARAVDHGLVTSASRKVIS